MKISNNMESLIVTTENGDKAFATSGNACLDFFTRITRNAIFSDYIDAFTKAWKENKETAYRLLMNMRDVRNGKGEKLIPIVLLLYLKFSIEPSVYEAILRKMIEYGYWKDLLKIIEIEKRTYIEKSKHSLFNTYSVSISIEVKLFVEQLKKDYDIFLSMENSDKTSKKAAISLCAKWAPSEKTHYDHHPMFIAKDICNAMNINPKQYRLMLTKLRNHIGVLETLMSTQRYDEIDFSKLPSVAMTKMKYAFSRDTNANGKESDERKKLHKSYSLFLRKLAEGKTKINIKGIQPHELVSTYMDNSDVDQIVEEQWKALKQRILTTGVFRNVTAIVDVSGSMNGQPMEVAIALGILIAECTRGPFHGKVITFHESPSWHHLIGETLKEQVQCMKSAPWGGSTDLRKVFDIILKDAIDGQLTQDEMVKTLFIFTDMQFNHCNHDSWESTFEYAKHKFENAGYKLPNIICWNLRTSINKSMPFEKNEKGFVMLSGFSAELLKCILTAEEFTPILMMMHVLEPYQVPMEVISSNVTELHSDPSTIKALEIAIAKSAIKKAFKKSNTSILSKKLSKSDSDSKESSSDSKESSTSK